jgi:6-phosphofructokinase 1
MAKNVLVALGGGTTQVINASVHGLVDACKSFPLAFDQIYAGRFGIEGILNEELLNLSVQPDDEIKLLSSTPASGVLGSCRYRLDESNPADFEQLLQVFHAHEIGYFFYIGGNDSMDTADKISHFALSRGLDVVVTGIPKTVDNDLGDGEFQLIDHTPGYGSAARFWVYTIREANQENAGACRFEPVLVLQAMGRKIGFIPAAARLGDPEREMPLLIFMAEAGFSLDEITDRIYDCVRKRGRALVVAGEGLELGSLGDARDGFGHLVYSATQTSAAQLLVNHLNHKGLPARGVARYNIPGTGQRNQTILASTVDIDEAYQLGQHAVQIAVKSGGGFMATLVRQPDENYRVTYGQVALERMANSERSFPSKWLTDSRTDVTDEFVRYARPLIGNEYPSAPLLNGLPRFARLQEIYAEQKLESYIPINYR